MSDSQRLFRNLAVANFFLYFGFNIWRGVFNNFAVEILGLHADQIGLLQSLRELPGLMGFVLGFLVLWMSERRVMAFSVLLLGVGLVVSGGSSTLIVLTLGTLLMSVGFHFFYPSNSSLVLMGVGKEDAPKLLGRLGSVAAIAACVAMVVVWIFVDGIQVGPLSIPGWGYRNVLYVTGAIVVVGGIFASRNGRSKEQAGPRLKRKVIFRREYGLYYVLTFLMGSRRHIFSTFAIFMLVEVHGISVRQTATLFLVNNLINSYTAAQLGRLVSRIGERKVLTLNFVGLIGVFLGYAYISNLTVLYLLFVLDNIFFGFNVAVDSYFQKIALSPQEITSNISMAQTINHISALVVPLLGGILWEQIAPSATFLAGAAIAVVSLVFVQFIRTHPVRVPAPLPLE